MSARNTLNAAMSLCLVLVSLSLSAWAQIPSQTENSSQVKDIVFRTTAVKTALYTLGKQLGMSVVFDESVKDSQKITIELHDIAIAQQASPDKPQNFEFRETEFKVVLSTLGKQLQLNIVFDDQVKGGDKVNVELSDVTVEQAMKIILIQKKYQARVIERNTIIVFPDNDTNRKRYAEYDLWPPKKDEKR